MVKTGEVVELRKVEGGGGAGKEERVKNVDGGEGHLKMKDVESS